jgi:hypothetical protein
MIQPKTKLTASITLLHTAYGSKSCKLWSENLALQKETAFTTEGKTVKTMTAKRKRI